MRYPQTHPFNNLSLQTAAHKRHFNKMSHAQTHKADKNILNTSSGKWRTPFTSRITSADSSGWFMCLVQHIMSHSVFIVSDGMDSLWLSTMKQCFFGGGSGCGCDPPCFLFSRRTGEGRVWCYCESCCLEERFRISEVDDNENPASPRLPCSMNSCLSRYWNLFCVCFSFFFFLFARQTPGHVAFVVTRSVIPPPPEIITALSF